VVVAWRPAALRGSRESWLVFFGQHTKTLDDKDRIIIPAEFRKALESGEGEPEAEQHLAPGADGSPTAAGAFFLTIPPGRESCISLYPRRYFTTMFMRFKPEDCFTDPDVQAYARIVVGRSRLVSCDKQGRVHLPAPLREECGIRKEVVLMGVIDHVEVWDVEEWRRYFQGKRPTMPEVATRIHRRDRSDHEQ
jgi:MraZ protein